jgi:phospholipid transport system transporter-binding protein
MPAVESPHDAAADDGAPMTSQASAAGTYRMPGPAMAVAPLPRVLTLGQARATAATLEAALAAAGSGGALRVDCTDLAELDTAALAVLLQSQRTARARGVRMTLHAAPAKLRALAALYGVDDLLGLEPAQRTGA